MGMKKHAMMTTTLGLRKAVDQFVANPSARRWLQLEACMHAHQYAFGLKEETAISEMAGLKTEDIIDNFAAKSHHGIAELKEAVESGRARVINEDYFRTRAAKPADLESTI